MNIVRGVTGLLRRGSVPQEGATSTSQGEQKESTPSKEPITWPEIQFNSDDRDEQVLESYWKRYKASSQKADESEEVESALAVFLNFVIERYETWVPAESNLRDDRRSSLGKRSHFISGCVFGHPTEVVVGLIQELKSVTRAITELQNWPNEKWNPSIQKRSEDLLHVLEIFSRSSHNRQIFKSSEGLQILVNTMKAAVIQLKRVVTIDETELLQPIRLSDILQGLLFRIVTIILQFIQRDVSMITENVSVEEPPRKVVSERTGTSEAVPLMELGGLNWFVELLRIVRKLRLSGVLVDFSLERLTLTTLKAALMANLRAQNHFKSLGGIDVLLDGIGSASRPAQCPAVVKEECFIEDFQMQVVSLEVLREAVFRNLSALQYVVESGGVDKFVGIILWAAFIFPQLSLQEKTMGESNLQGWNSHVSYLCKILCSFLAESGDIHGFVTGLAGSYDALGTAGSYWELAMQWIVKILLGIFRNMSSLQISRQCSTNLHHYVLYIFKKMLAVSPVVLKLFHEEGLWDVMFSEHFFYFAMGDTVSYEQKSSNQHTEEEIDSERLRLEVISFVELAATSSHNSDNAPECHALIVALEQCARLPNVATMIVKSLHRILQLAPEQTVLAFQKLEALVLLSQVMNIQLLEYVRVTENNSSIVSTKVVLEDVSGNVQTLTLKETWKLAREAVFDLFAEYVLTSEKARIVSLHSTKTLRVLFDLLWDSESRKFSLGHILDVMKLPPTSEEDQEAKLELCIKYLEALSQTGLDGKTKDIDMLLDLLGGIREVLETDPLYYQSLFQNGECFVHIVSLLNENLSKENGKTLCLSVLQTLRHLLAGNNSSKNAFRSLVGAGYTTLQTLLLSSHYGSPTEELLNSLLDMLVDGEFSVPENMLIQNEDVIAVFFSILRQSNETLQLFGLTTFEQILDDSTTNRAACVKAGLLSLLLDWFGNELNESLMQKIATLIKVLGCYSITGKDMRKIFSLLRNANQTSKTVHRKVLLNFVQDMLNEEGPTTFFGLSGKDSGIDIKCSMRWPSVKGFAFSCWMRVETFPSVGNLNSLDALMGLFNFMTESGRGYNALIGQEKIVIQISGQKGQSCVLSVQIPDKRWCHVCISHSVGRALSGGGVLKFYLDGVLVTSDKLRYPKILDPLSRCTVGASCPIMTSELPSQAQHYSLPFCGQFGPVYFFDDPLSQNQIMAVFQAGPGYMYSFLPTEIGSIPENMASNTIFDLKDGLSSRAIFGFNAKASSGEKIYDVVLNSDAANEKVSHEAKIMKGTQLFSRRLVKDIIDCVGGVGVLFPLLTQLDQPISSMAVSFGREESSNVQYLSSYNVYVAAEVIELVTSVLNNSSTHQLYMYQHKGMSIIGFLLQSVSPQHLTTEVATALVHLLSVVCKSSETSFSSQLVEETLIKIFLNLNIWIYTPFTVQRELLIALLNYCETETDLARSHISLPRILDLVQHFYWDKPKSRKVAGNRRLLHPVTKEVIGERPSREEIGKLRILLLSLAEVVVRDSVSISDVKALIAYLERSEDPVCSEDVLNMLLRLLGRKVFAAMFVENIQIIGGFQLFLSLLERQEECLRLLGLQIIGVLLISSIPYEKKGSWLLTLATGVRASFENTKSEKAKLSPLYAAMMERLILFPFTDLLCATLFDMLLGGASMKQVLQRGSVVVQETPAQNSQFVLPQILGILMKFLLICDNLETCCGVMRDILRLLEANPSSSEAIVNESSWQCWFLDLLVNIQDRKLVSKDPNVSSLFEEELLVHNIFTMILCYSIYNIKGGWKHLERSVNLIHIYAEKSMFPKSHLLHQLFGDLLEALLQARTQDSGPMPQPCRDNTLYLLSLMDELLIKDVIQVLPFPDEGTNEGTSENVSFTSPTQEYADVQELSNRFVSDSSTTDNELRVKEGAKVTDSQLWVMYDRIWLILRDMHGKDRGDFIGGPTFGQRARGLVESINIPAAEMAAAVVAGGLGAVVNMNPGKLIDKAVKLRGDRFPRIVFHLVLLYIHRASLEVASSCVHQFVGLLPVFLTTDSDQCRNRLQLLLWCLLEARTKLALLDNGARFHLISQLIRDTVDGAKNMLVSNLVEKDESINDVASVQNLLQQDRIVNAVKEESAFLKSSVIERSTEVELFNTEMKDADEAGKSNLKFLEEQRQCNLSVICASESSRIAAVQSAHEEDQQVVSNQWCHMFRYLTDERGPWSTMPYPNDIQISWKLDKTEDPWRRRLKLKRNYHFDSRLLNDEHGGEMTKSTAIAAEKMPSFDALLETSKLLMKGLRGISEEEVTDTSAEDTDFVEELSSDAKSEGIGVPTLEPLENVEETSESIQDQEVKKAEEVTDEIIHSSVCVLVIPKRKLAGRLDMTAESLHFFGDFLVEGTGGSSVFTAAGSLNYADHILLDSYEKGATKPSDSTQERVDAADSGQGASKNIKRHRRWDLHKVRSVHGTRYLLQHTALEVFFENSIPPVFLNFSSHKVAREVGSKIISLKNNLLIAKATGKERIESKYFVDKRLALELAERYRDLWRRREINNFEYLMLLNTLAGRSYNDLTQYPVFPWIICDYTSDTLDLNSPSTFRDLSKPVGALDAKRFEVFEERFRNFSDPDIPSFYYGSHYSSMGIVLFYLLRLEPFTSLHRNLQGGKFDHADRLFHSIEGTYKNCLANTSDVKELIPEFYYMPEFLVNSNKYYMGVKQDGEKLDNVVLPPWANGSPDLFISKNREALESEYVSQHLHEWIDLIFGYKQRGRPAVEAANVFYHLTYEGAVELEGLEDRLQRAAVEDQIANFGQTPMQLFRKKHPRRGPGLPIARPLYYAPASITLTSSVPADMLSSSGAGSTSLLFVGIVEGKVVVVTSELKMIVRSWITAAQAGGNFTFSSSQDPFFGVGAELLSPHKIRGPFSENIELNSLCFRTLNVRTSSFLLTCGHWDNSFRITSLNDGSLLQSNRHHKDVVSCLAVSSDGSILVTGSHDTTVMVWEVESLPSTNKKTSNGTDKVGKRENMLFDTPRYVLSGHDDAVTCVAVSVELDLIVSGSKDCSCIFYTLREGRYVRSIQHPLGNTISMLVLSKHGKLVVFSRDDLMFLLYSVNGKLLIKSESNGRINCMELSSCGEFLVCGGDHGHIIVRSIYTLQVIRKYDGTNTPILSLAVTPEDCFLSGMQDGSLLIYSIEKPTQKKTSLLLTLRGRTS